MNLRLFWSLEVVGGLLVVLGAALGIIGIDKIGVTLPQGDYAAFAIVFMGVFLIMIATVPILYEKNKTKQQRIEEKDERVIAIYQTAKVKTFNLMAVSIPFVLIGLALFGFMNKVSFFTLGGLYLIFIEYFAFQVIKNGEMM
ncbi:hypothetical protein FPQ10_05715 [Allobacillus sp. SKP2-8]|uniref:hypothetical protein n=1 Tax=unclassified Allobacillus TaxID=2628859 RepID=UPI0011835607|nr:hypothetical protein [Allobacillus sp. SKP2-8]TSJ67295.1 hypothetical protein FPQ10_05715 [Allobacillus sp. SKP2-8]